jgi:hypothetical protein
MRWRTALSARDEVAAQIMTTTPVRQVPRALGAGWPDARRRSVQALIGSAPHPRVVFVREPVFSSGPA